MTKISKWGNSAAVRIPAAALEAAGLAPGDDIEFLARKGGLEIRRAGPQPSYTLEELVAEMDRLGPEARPPFEDWGVLPSEWPQEDWSDIAPSDEEMGITSAGNNRARTAGR